MTSYWHVLKSTRVFGAEAVQSVWDEERAAAIVTAGYGNEPEGPGRAKLRLYEPGDRVIVYAPGFGAVGSARVIGIEPAYRSAVAAHEHAHILAVEWRATVSRLRDAVPPMTIKAADCYLPRTLAMRIAENVADRLEAAVVEAASSQESSGLDQPETM